MPMSIAFIYYLAKIKPILVKWQVLEYMSVQVFLNFLGYDFRDFRFNAVYDSVPFFDFRGHVSIYPGFCSKI